VARLVGASHLRPSGLEGSWQPIAFDDYALQFYYAQLGARFLTDGGVTWGYDPNFLAGYPKTPIYYPSSKPYEFVLALFQGRDPAALFNWTVFGMLALVPFLMYGAAANFRLSPVERLCVVALSLVPHLLVPSASFYSTMEAAGMVPFIFASALAVFVVSLVHRFLAEGGGVAAGGLLVGAPLLYLIHPAATLLSALPIGVIYLTRARSLPLARHLWMWIVLIAVGALNWPWIEAYLLFSHYADLGDFYTPQGVSQFAPAGGWLAPLRVWVPAPKLLGLLPPVFGLIGLLAWWREGRRDLLIVFAPQILMLFVVTYYGVALGMAAVAPGRITLPLAQYLFFPTAHGLVVTATLLFTWAQRVVLPQRGGAAVVLVAAALPLLLLAELPAKFFRPYTLEALEEHEGFAERGMALLRWLEEHTDASGRILHEETSRRTHQYYGTHMPAWIPLFTGTELASGPAPHSLLQHNFLRFIAGTFRGQPLHAMDDARLSTYLSLYNVRWVLCWTPGARHDFDRRSFATPLGTFDKFALYRIEQQPSYFLRGSGRIERRGQNLLLRDLEPEDGIVALKYHWLESLRSDPPRTLEPFPMLDDPVPFLSVRDPPRELLIFNDFDYGLWDR
jgi:hypothetical protein